MRHRSKVSPARTGDGSEDETGRVSPVSGLGDLDEPRTSQERVQRLADELLQSLAAMSGRREEPTRHETVPTM